MASSTNPVKSTALIPYAPEDQPWTQAKKQRVREIDEVATRSLNLQLTDSRLLPSPLSRECILAGASPRPLLGPGLPTPYPGTRDDFMRTASETVHATLNGFDYNGLQPFLKTIEQMQNGSSLLETTMDARGEEPGTTCIGMSHAVLKQLKALHGIEGSLAAKRQVGHFAFEHAAVIIECRDGYVLIEPNSNPNQRFFSIPFHGSLQTGALSFTAAGPGSSIPLSINGIAEYCTNIANGDELVAKHFMMEAPFMGKDPAFPVSAYYPNGDGSKMVWVSPLRSKLTLINATLAKGDPARKHEISFDEVRQGELRPRLEQLYDKGQPSFHIPLDTLHHQLITFVENAAMVDQMFRDVRYRNSQ